MTHIIFPKTRFFKQLFMPALFCAGLTGFGVSSALGYENASFSKPFAAMAENRKMDFLLGKAMFKKLWVSAPASTQASDGLGPLYNARSCLSCHPKNGRGQPPRKGEAATSLFLQLSVPPLISQQKLMVAGKLDHVPDPIYGSQLQNRAVQGFGAEGQLQIRYSPVMVKLAGGEQVTLQQPAYSILGAGYGDRAQNLQVSPRLAPQMIGLGLLEAIAAQDILKNADPQDKDGNGISGKASKVWSYVKNTVMLGRFGWKASTPSVLEQSSRALNSDIGISNPVFKAPFGDCTAAQKTCRNAPNGNTKRDHNLEIGKMMNDRLAFYAANLAVPAPRNPNRPNIARGKLLFNAIGCANCHKPSFRTAKISGQNSHLSSQTIWPYTDLLLHDMGKALADGRPVHNATGKEWRTAPLWGIGLSQTINANSHFLHDGRARSLKEAILWHGGEATQTRTNFSHLPKEDRDKLIAFVKSL